MSPALEYLRTLPAYVINLDGSTDRWANIEQRVKPLVASVTRVPGVDGRRADPVAVDAFKTASYETMRREPKAGLQPKQTEPYWRRTYGAYMSHTRAIISAADRHDRFLILEDDAFPRLDLLARTEAPPRDQGLNVWGGALLGGSYARHWRADLPDVNRWSQLPLELEGTRDRWQATALEMSSKTAVEYLRIIERHPQTYDASWWWAFAEIPTRVPQVEVIPQDLLTPSELNPSATLSRQRFGRRLIREHNGVHQLNPNAGLM